MTGLEVALVGLAGTAVTALSAWASARSAARGGAQQQFGEVLAKRDERLWRVMEEQAKALSERVADLERLLDEEQDARRRLEARLDACPATPCPLRPQQLA